MTICISEGTGIATGWTVGFRFPTGKDTFFYYATSRPALGPTKSPIKWVPGDLSLGEKQLGGEIDHSLQFTSEVENGGAVHPLPHTPSLRGVQLIKRRDNFAFFTFNRSRKHATSVSYILV
jgi:hypothetical protein